MSGIIRLVGANQAVELFGVQLVGVSAQSGKKVLFTLAFILFVTILGWILRKVASWLLQGRQSERVRFWTRQGITVIIAALLIVGAVSIWFDDPTRLTTALGLVTAGLAFALQRVVTAVAAYLVILQGKTFNIGDRITMGGVRGDVIALSFVQTTIMEMGEPPSVQGADPAMWVRARQYTGRIVIVTNDKIFDQPVYNFTRDFPYIWEEMSLPISYTGDRKRAEQIMLESARRHTLPINELSEDALQEMERRYAMKKTDLVPKVYYRLTDNWIELSIRFLARDFGVRDLKDQMSRDILAEFETAGIGIASGTYEIVGMPPLQIKNE